MGPLDLAGHRFGRLLAISVHAQGQGRVWLCRCDCGAMTTAPARKLRAGRKQSCGCLKCCDLTGRRSGRLVVVGPYKIEPYGHRSWRCRCDCGQIRWVRAHRLTGQTTRSCGCITRETLTRHGHARSRQYHPLYGTWMTMVQRCRNPHRKCYSHYGGRGIRVCEKWEQSFPAFLADVGERPSPHHTLDRIDNDGHYEPGNVRWATPIVQGRNRSVTVRVTAFGRTLRLDEWAAETGLTAEIIRARMRDYGWSPEAAVSKPARRV
jgi:hypothetical protein